MALTRLLGNSNGDTKADACQRKTPGRVESSSSPGAKLPSARCKTADGGLAAGGVLAGGSAVLAAELVTSPTSIVETSSAKRRISRKKNDAADWCCMAPIT